MPTTHHTTLGVAGLRTETDPEHTFVSYDPDLDSLGSFQAQVERLATEYGAETRQAFYLDEERDQVEAMEHHRVNINPAWEGAGLADAPPGRTDAAWTTVTTGYEPVDAQDAFGPLMDAMDDRSLGGLAFGAFELYRDGGEVCLDLFVPEMAFELEAGEERRDLVPGVHAGYSHYADQRVYAEPIVLDTHTGAIHRHLADRRKRRHVKPHGTEGTTADEVAAWWDNELDRLDAMGDVLVQTVQEAMDYEVGPIPGPFDAEDFYQALGLPADVAEAAAGPTPDALKGSLPTAWDLFDAASAALTHHYEGKTTGRALQNHARAVNDLLHRPATAEASALESLAERDEADQADLTGRTVARELEDRATDLNDAAERYESFRDRLRGLAEGTDPEESDA